MALVAYSDDSEISSDSDDLEQQGIGEKTGRFSGISSEKSIVNEHESHIGNIPTILASIPAPVPIKSLLNDQELSEGEDELTDVPTADTWIKKITNTENGFEPPKKKAKAKVKFFVPALSEFAEDEDDEEPKEEPERKKVQPSCKKSGLFSVLPEPKHITVKESKRQLIPHILTKPPPSVKISKKPTPTQLRMAHGRKAESVVDSDEDDAEPSDFFSLTNPSSALDTATTVPASPVKAALPQVATDYLHKTKDYSYSTEHEYKNQVDQVSIGSTTCEPQEEYQDSLQPEVQSSNQHFDIDQEAMVRLMGKRRGKGEEINFINVSADDALLTRDEWMTKALSEEKPTHSFSKKKEGLPSQKQKQKHQITYLAHQAKERELELKNNWAQNRMTKMQTQAKYGF